MGLFKRQLIIVTLGYSFFMLLYLFFFLHVWNKGFCKGLQFLTEFSSEVHPVLLRLLTVTIFNEQHHLNQVVILKPEKHDMM